MSPSQWNLFKMLTIFSARSVNLRRVGPFLRREGTDVIATVVMVTQESAEQFFRFILNIILLLQQDLCIKVF